MKHLLLFLLCQGSLDSFCQVADKLYLWPDGKLSVLNPGTSKSDTLRATLLMTRGSMQASYAYEGYVIMKDGEIVECLDDKKRPFKSPLIIWGCKVRRRDD